MPKIRNWSRMQSREKGNTVGFWKHSAGGDLLIQKDGKGGYSVNTQQVPQPNQVRRKFDKSENAFNFARKYMKNHPRV